MKKGDVQGKKKNDIHRRPGKPRHHLPPPSREGNSGASLIPGEQKYPCTDWVRPGGTYHRVPRLGRIPTFCIPSGSHDSSGNSDTSRSSGKEGSLPPHFPNSAGSWPPGSHGDINFRTRHTFPENSNPAEHFVEQEKPLNRTFENPWFLWKRTGGLHLEN